MLAPPRASHSDFDIPDGTYADTFVSARGLEDDLWKASTARSASPTTTAAFMAALCVYDWAAFG